MKTYNVMLQNLGKQTIPIGYQGENMYTQVRVNCVTLFSSYPNASVSMVIRPPVGDIYPAVVERNGVMVIWNITSSVLSTPGAGSAQLTFTNGNEIIKTAIFNFNVMNSLVANGEPPEPYADWLEEANEALNEFGKINDLTASATTLSSDASATAEITNIDDHKNIAIGIPRGEKGDKGDTGDPATAEQVQLAVNAYLAQVITNPDSPPLDRTLSSSSGAAPADMVGDLKSAFIQFQNSEISPLPLIQNEYIKTDGTVDTYNTWARTDYIDIGFCKRLSVKSTVYSQYNSFYDENKNPISPFNITLQSSSAIVTVPNNAKYMRLSNTAAGMENLVIKFYTANDSTISDLSKTAVTGSGAFTTGGSPTITDADDADANTIHAIPISNRVLHTPSGNVLGNLITFGYAKGATVNKSQLMLRNDGKSIYYRSLWDETEGYSDWSVISGGEIIVAPGGGGNFDNLTDAIADGITKPNTVIRVKPGVYDIVSELTQNYMDTHEFTATDRGIELNNGIHLIFDSGVFVVCNYSGANETVHKFFSVFNVSGSCEVENLNLVASNLRYAIHDENGGNNVPYRVVWRGCNITFDNSQNPDWSSKKIIGGGLGKYADILIENCYFNPQNIDSAGIPNGCITYHNNTSVGSKSHVVIRDCYFEKSTFSIRWYGNSTEITDCICCGNSFTAGPTCIAETASAPNVNVVMYAWNNEVRN